MQPHFPDTIKVVAVQDDEGLFWLKIVSSASATGKVYVRPQPESSPNPSPATARFRKEAVNLAAAAGFFQTAASSEDDRDEQCLRAMAQTLAWIKEAAALQDQFRQIVDTDSGKPLSEAIEEYVEARAKSRLQKILNHFESKQLTEGEP